MQLIPPGTPLPQEIAGGSTAVPAPANDRASAAIASKQTARMNQTRRMCFDFNLLAARPRQLIVPVPSGATGSRRNPASPSERSDGAFLRPCQFERATLTL